LFSTAIDPATLKIVPVKKFHRRRKSNFRPTTLTCLRANHGRGFNVSDVAQWLFFVCLIMQSLKPRLAGNSALSYEHDSTSFRH